MATADIEKSSPEARRDGFPAVAAWMARDPDNETLVFRKFDELRVRSLLNLQCELIDLESKLKLLDEEARKGTDMELKQSLRNWKTFSNNSATRKEEKDRMELLNKIHSKLSEYHKTLILQHQVAKLDRPNSRVLNLFRNWLSGGINKADGRKIDPVLGGLSMDLLDDEQDLVALRVAEGVDPLSRLLRDHWPFSVQNYQGSQHQRGQYMEKHIVWAVAIVSTITATTLLIGAIVSLYFVKQPSKRLAMIACFTVLFAISVGLLTNAQRAETFAATAAYAAVLVVFVSGDLGSPSSMPS